jgi:hypothetical protein
VGRCHVQERSGDLRANHDRVRRARQGHGVAGAAGGEARQAGGGGGVDEPRLDEDLLDLDPRDRTQPEADTARADRGQEALLIGRGEDQHRAGGRLLERLEERRLGVLGHAIRGGDDRDPRAALDGQQRQVPDEVADPTLLTAADRDDEARPGRAQPMQVGMISVLEGAAGPARPARPARQVVGAAQQPRRNVLGERALADPGRPGEQQGVRHPATEHGHDGRHGGRLTAGPESRARGQRLDHQVTTIRRPAWRSRSGRRPTQTAGSAFLRVTRRFKAADASPSSAGAASAVEAAVAALDVVRRVLVARGRFAAGATASVPPSVGAVSAFAAAVARGFRAVVRRAFGAASAVTSAG